MDDILNRMSIIRKYVPRWFYEDSDSWIARRQQDIESEAKRQALLEANGAHVPQDHKNQLQAAREELAVIVRAIGKEKMD